MCVYAITNKTNGKVYVGQTVNSAGLRWQSHITTSGAGVSAIKHAIRKHGVDAFDFCVIDLAETREQLNHKEQFWVEHLNTLSPNGYNLVSGGNARGEVSEETRNRISLSKIGKPTWLSKHGLNKEMIEKIRLAKTGVKMPCMWKKVVRSDGVLFESIDSAASSLGVSPKSISAVLSGVAKTSGGYAFDYYTGGDVLDAAESLAHKLKEHREEETKNRRARAKAVHTGRKKPPHFGEIARLTHTGVKRSEEAKINSARAHMSCKVILCSNGKTYLSSYEAAKDTGVDKDKIGNVCTGKRKSTGGLTFAYGVDE
jgi:hypothetical protein